MQSAFARFCFFDFVFNLNEVNNIVAVSFRRHGHVAAFGAAVIHVAV